MRPSDTARLSDTHRPRSPTRAVAAAVALAVLLAISAFPAIERYYMERAGAADTATLQLATQVLRGALERTEALPALIAERPILARLLEEPDNDGLVPFVNELLRQSALSLDVSDIYLMDTEGLTIAASNYRTDRSFLGQRFDYRPYFTDALTDGLGRFHALGTTSNQRGYFFAAPVIDAVDIVGVVAVKITLDGFEATWAQTAATLIVTDANNVVFLSDRPDWHFRTFGPVSELMVERMAATRQYPLDRLSPLNVSRAPLADGMERVSIADDQDYILQTALIAAPGWRVSILTPRAPATQSAIITLSVALLLIVVTGLIAAIVLQRRAQLIERLAVERGQALLLEARVADRTRDLDDANRQLTAEVEERRLTEERLRRTQAELVQAGKLAALGQMSAALSHEFNQPLAAVKSYAENAATFLDRGRVEEARGNITRISGMADRMAAISKHLRNFARRPQDKTGPVPLRAVVADALDLMEARLAKAGADMRYTPPETEIWVRGGRVRLQQVLVNLIGNALDAMQGAQPVIEITLEATPRPLIRVRDRGPGLSEAALMQAFDPFFTTKGPGQGLGLGLSISYNIIRDFGGHMAVANDPEGGAVFTVSLEAAMPDGKAELAAE